MNREINKIWIGHAKVVNGVYIYTCIHSLWITVYQPEVLVHDDNDEDEKEDDDDDDDDDGGVVVMMMMLM